MYEYGCQVTRVVDGDTIDVDLDLGFDIRYEGQSKKDIQLEHLKNRDILIKRGLHTLIENENT